MDQAIFYVLKGAYGSSKGASVDGSTQNIVPHDMARENDPCHNENVPGNNIRDAFWSIFLLLCAVFLAETQAIFSYTECKKLSDGSFDCESPSTVCSFSCNVTGCDDKKPKAKCPRVTSYLCRNKQDPDPTHAQRGYHYESMTLRDAMMLLEQIEEQDIEFAHYFRYRFGM